MNIPAAAPSFRFSIGRYRFGRYRRGDWELDDGCVGASGHRTPIHAIFGLKRARRIAKTIPPNE